MNGSHTGADVDALIDRVVAAHRALADARAHLDEAVEAARSGGLSWAAIGRALGVTRQAAWERFSRTESL